MQLNTCLSYKMLAQNTGGSLDPALLCAGIFDEIHIIRVVAVEIPFKPPVIMD